MTRIVTLVAAAAAALAFGAANATPLSDAAAGFKATAEDSSLIEHVHHGSTACKRGRVKEWDNAIAYHRHDCSTCPATHCRPH
jgi:hypothetical protein